MKEIEYRGYIIKPYVENNNDGLGSHSEVHDKNGNVLKKTCFPGAISDCKVYIDKIIKRYGS